ncbi:MAG: hypothetical protein IJF13_03160, partial [Clostridia bacterium]|nr:hypothetical protein [Clostridia bacterium]
AKFIYFHAFDTAELFDFEKDMSYMLEYFTDQYNEKGLSEYKTLDLSDIEKYMAEKRKEKNSK